MNEFTQRFLLKLARQTLEYYFKTHQILKLDESILPDPIFKEKRGTFVTLHLHGELRGCIGHIEPVQELYKDIIDNVLSAAFEDPRFIPLTGDELKDIEIEISVLTPPQKLSYTSTDDLLIKLRPNIDGVIIEKGRYGATYLPQVWEDLPDKKEFLSSLCMKAGLNPDAWKEKDAEISVYQAEVFNEHVTQIT